MTDSVQKLAVKEKMGYACGDIATNFFFQSMILYQTRFYTDTVGLAAVAVGTMFLVLRLADAVFDPVIGALSDRTQTRWGKFRPWVLFTAIPFGIAFWLVYVTPNVMPHGRLIYAYITYTMVMMLYSASNTPYSALMGVMTPDSSERSSIASYRFVGALIGQFIIQALPLPLVAKLGQGSSDRGWAVTMAIFGSIIILFVGALIGQFVIQALPLPLVSKLGHGSSARRWAISTAIGSTIILLVGALIGRFIIHVVAILDLRGSARGWAMSMAIFGSIIILLNLIAFASTRERVHPAPGQKSSLRADLKDVFTCGPWIVMFVLTLLIFTMLVVRGSSLNYFFAYYLDQGQIKALLEKFGLASMGAGPVTGWRSLLDGLGLLVKPDASNAAAVGLSLFFVLGSLIQIVGIILSKPLADRFGKKTVFLAGMSVTAIATALVFLVTPTSMTLLIALSVLWPVGWGPTVPLLWVMIADVADYSEWKNYRRATGFMYAGILFALKAGLSLGGALSAWVLAAYGYRPNVAQTEHSLLGIRLAASIYPAVALLFCLVCLSLYPIGKKLNIRIQDELVERRKGYASGNTVAASS
jgi:Na+/melibiose symporter-like transporter